MPKIRTENYTPFGKKVKIALIQNDMSNRDLARAMGCTESTVCDVIKGRNRCERRKEEITQILNLN